MSEERDIYTAKQKAKAYLLGRLGQRAGVGVGDNRIRIYLQREEDREAVPAQFDDFPVEIIVTGEVKAYGK